MQDWVELSFRHMEPEPEVEELVKEKAAKLEEVHNHISRCRVVIEKLPARIKRGNPYRVRIDVLVPPGHELVAKREPGHGPKNETLEAVIRDTFRNARRQLKELKERQRHHVKAHSRRGPDTQQTIET